MAVAPDFENEEPVPGTSLEGLGHAWEADELVRGHALQNGGALLSWPSPKHVGVINFSTAACNAKVLSILLEIWCPQVPHVKTVNIDQLRGEVGLPKKIVNFNRPIILNSQRNCVLQI